MKLLRLLWRARTGLGQRTTFTGGWALAQVARGQTINRSPWPWIYAGRPGGLFSDSAACTPARRIGIGIWEAQSWTPTIRLVKSNTLKNFEADQQRKKLNLFGIPGCNRHAVRSSNQCLGRYDQRHGGKLRFCPGRRYHQS